MLRVFTLATITNVSESKSQGRFFLRRRYFTPVCFRMKLGHQPLCRRVLREFYPGKSCHRQDSTTQSQRRNVSFVYSVCPSLTKCVQYPVVLQVGGRRLERKLPFARASRGVMDHKRLQSWSTTKTTTINSDNCPNTPLLRLKLKLVTKGQR